MKTARVHIAVFVSGEGTTLQALLDSQEANHYRVSLVVANRECGALARASKAGVPTLLSRDWEEITGRLREAGIELIVLAGYLAIIPEAVCEQWAGRMINTHPSLLPKFGGKGMYGRRVHEAVLAAGERETGCTVHYVSSAVDGGEVIAQARVPVLANDTPDTLAARVQATERELLPKVVEQLLIQNYEPNLIKNYELRIKRT
ncbi:MAG: phosphoribosylglycinamide formyltransferase [Paludibacteraceae bacterium]